MYIMYYTYGPYGGFHKRGYPQIIHFKGFFSIINDPFEPSEINARSRHSSLSWPISWEDSTGGLAMRRRLSQISVFLETLTWSA